MAHKVHRLPPFTFLIFLFSAPVWGQDCDLGNWFLCFGNKQLNTSWNGHYQTQYCNYNLEQLLLRVGISHDPIRNKSLLIGYASIPSENYTPGTNEKATTRGYRTFQQCITRQNHGRFYWLYRYRFEQWCVEDDFTMRLRYFLLLNVPIMSTGTLANTLYLSAYSKIFINTGRSLFDRGKIYGGLGYRINGPIRVEVGYMNQILETQNRDPMKLILF